MENGVHALTAKIPPKNEEDILQLFSLKAE